MKWESWFIHYARGGNNVAAGATLVQLKLFAHAAIWVRRINATCRDGSKKSRRRKQILIFVDLNDVRRNFLGHA
jgi:hypothetical protein